MALRDSQLRRNLSKATTTIRAKREGVVGEVPDWQELREAGRAIKDSALVALDRHLVALEAAVVSAGGVVHWANDGNEGCSIVADIARSHGVDEVVKVKSIATDEIKLNEHLASVGVRAVETDLAELIIQLGDDVQSHILVPAIHKNRAEIRDLFARELDLPDLTDEPEALTEAARVHLRRKFLSARMGVSGANFAVAETGTVSVFESEGNGRMCTTLPEVLVTVMGIEKLVPTWRDMEVFLQLLPRSSTGERMNPYTSFWTGVRPGDGPQEFHLVLLDNGRTGVLADQVGRQALRCIRCSACLNVCPVYSRTGGHAYESVYPGPIGAILTPQLSGLESGRSLPYASSLCGACYEVCPVEIDIPRVLVHLRSRVVDTEPWWRAEKAAMKAHVPCLLLRPRVRAGAGGGAAWVPAARAARPHRAPAVAAVGLDRHARPPRAAQGDLPRLVAARAGRSRTRRRATRVTFAAYIAVNVTLVEEQGRFRAGGRPRRDPRPDPGRAGGPAAGGGSAARLQADQRRTAHPHHCPLFRARRGIPRNRAERHASRTEGGDRRAVQGGRCGAPGGAERSAKRVAPWEASSSHPTPASAPPSSTPSTAPSPAARSRSPRPGPSS